MHVPTRSGAILPPLSDLGDRRVRQHFVLAVLVDSHRMVPRRRDWFASPSPSRRRRCSRTQLLRKMMPFCYPDRGETLLSALPAAGARGRRARGVSAWSSSRRARQRDHARACLANRAYNPMSANLRELLKRIGGGVVSVPLPHDPGRKPASDQPGEQRGQTIDQRSTHPPEQQAFD